MNESRKKYIKNVKKPSSNFYGRKQLKSMNSRHNTLALWGLQFLDFKNKLQILDVGCGGGKNIENLLALSPSSKVFGLDYSQASVEMSQKHNSKAVKAGKTQIMQGSVEELPYDENNFDIVTAFETIYFWQLEKGFEEVFRVLKNKGLFLVVNEANNKEELKEYIEIIGFNVYTANQIADKMEKIGFSNIKKYAHENGKWIAIVGEKA